MNYCLIGLPQHNSLYTYFQRLPTNAQRVYVGVNHSCDSAIHREAVPNGVCDGIREVAETRVFQKCLEHVFDWNNNFITLLTLNENTSAVLLKSWKRGRAVGSTSESNSRKRGDGDDWTIFLHPVAHEAMISNGCFTTVLTMTTPSRRIA